MRNKMSPRASCGPAQALVRGVECLPFEEGMTVKIGAPREIEPGEARVAMTPDSALQLQKLGYECLIEAGAGVSAGFSDAAYKEAGVEVVKTAAALWKGADIVAKVRPPTTAEAEKLGQGQLLISFFYPGANEALMELARSRGANVIAMDMVPRISRAQKMDALSSVAIFWARLMRGTMSIAITLDMVPRISRAQ